MQKVRNILLAVIVPALLLAPVVGTLSARTYAASNAKDQICSGLGGSGGAGCKVTDQPDINSTLSNVIDLFSAITGIAAVIMIVVAGFRFVTAQGDSNTVSSARRTILYAAVGLAIVALSQTLVKFILGKIT